MDKKEYSKRMVTIALMNAQEAFNEEDKEFIDMMTKDWDKVYKEVMEDNHG